jgi:lipopolysaccharide transport system ATP-binding protein
MMTELAIVADKLGKLYRIGARQARYRTFRETLIEGVTSPIRRLRSAVTPRVDQTIWALRDVSVEVWQGEVLGVIGRNGAGKTTLLKILSRITEPTEGLVAIHGRVGSLLEVGTGFHPELTGRENIYLNGAILGMKKAEIERRFDEIVSFAEVEKFIDTPVKHYSSGMYMRLAFSIAAHLEPEILLVDEVLAVGDAAFQRKCLGKMGDVAKEGRTVLFVSHNLQAISTLTERTLVLETGNIIFNGETSSALGQYRALWDRVGTGEYVDPTKSTGVTRAKVVTSELNQIHRFGKPLTFEFEISFKEKPKLGAFSFQIIDDQARPVTHLWLFDSDQRWSRTGQVFLRCNLPNPRVYMGHYSLVTYLSDRASLQHYETLEGICPFEVVMDGIPREYEWAAGACTYLEDAEWLVI